MPQVPLLCLLAFALWPIVLVTGIGLFRVPAVLMGKAQANSFPSGTKHGSDLYWRINRAHMNTLESLPVFASVVLVGVVAHANTPTFDHLAVATVIARVCQSAAHISGNSNMHVNVRFTFFVVQLVCFVGKGLVGGAGFVGGWGRGEGEGESRAMPRPRRLLRAPEPRSESHARRHADGVSGDCSVAVEEVVRRERVEVESEAEGARARQHAPR